MKLYCSPWTLSLGPQILAYEAGAHITVIPVDAMTGRAEDGRDLADLDPFGALPLLEVVDGATLREPGAILQAMIALAPSEFHAPPSDTIDAFRLAQWLEFGSGRLALAMDRGASGNRRDGLARTTLDRCLAWMDVQLGLRPFLLTQGYSIADIHIWALLHRGMSDTIEVHGHRSVRFDPAHSNVQRWYDALENRPAVQAVLASESRVSPAVMKLAAVR